MNTTLRLVNCYVTLAEKSQTGNFLAEFDFQRIQRKGIFSGIKLRRLYYCMFRWSQIELVD
jgi:hypothetical protein